MSAGPSPRPDLVRPRPGSLSGARAIAAATAILVVAGLTVQVLLAGLALFADASLWSTHGMFGGLIGVPILGLAVAALIHPELRGLRFHAVVLAGLYVLQVLLAVSADLLGGWIAALHPLNAVALMRTSAALVEASIRKVPH